MSRDFGSMPIPLIYMLYLVGFYTPYLIECTVGRINKDTRNIFLKIVFLK